MSAIKTAELKQFVLTDLERKIFDTLLRANQMFRLGTTFRVAGGWVRDKLLGKDSDDLDIALDNLTGRQMEEVLLKMGVNYGVGKSYTVKADVEKSKHLDTVAIEIWGQKIDFVNLRTEQYGESRVPTMEMGTPDVDAQRRDLTINALFYNVNTGQIEDYVGGLQDLETMTLRTPLDPRKTFMDDPLRMMRVLRFYSRYPNASIDPKLLQAMALPEVLEAYRKKVSSERAGPEIMKMLAGARPAEALRYMFDTGLDKAVFNVPETQNLLDLRMDQRNKHHIHNLLDHTLLVVKNMSGLMQQEGAPPDMRVKMLLAALFHDYGKAHPEIGKPKETDPTQYQYLGHEDESVKIADSIMKSISIPEADRRFVTKIVGLHMRPHEEGWGPKAIGRFLRDTEIPGQESGEVWRYVWLHGLADSMATKQGPELDQEVQTKREMMDRIRAFKARPAPAPVSKPILDGFKVMKMFPTLKPNSGYIVEVNQRMLEAQDEGTITDEASAMRFLETIRPEIVSKYEKGKPTTTAEWVRQNCRFAQEQV